MLVNIDLIMIVEAVVNFAGKNVDKCIDNVKNMCQDAFYDNYRNSRALIG